MTKRMDVWEFVQKHDIRTDGMITFTEGALLSLRLEGERVNSFSFDEEGGSVLLAETVVSSSKGSWGGENVIRIWLSGDKHRLESDYSCGNGHASDEENRRIMDESDELKELLQNVGVLIEGTNWEVIREGLMLHIAEASNENLARICASVNSESLAEWITLGEL
jgi:hypothetical protein